MKKVLSLGALYVDINSFNFPLMAGIHPGNQVVGNEYSIVLGGSALNFAFICSSLGLRSVFIGKRGEDYMGRILTDLIEKTAITPALITSPDVQTNVSLHFTNETHHEAITVTVGTANPSLTPAEVESKLQTQLDGVDYFYLGGCFKFHSLIPSYMKFIQMAKEKKVKVVLDHGRITNIVSTTDMNLMKEIISLVDYYLPSRAEFMKLWEVNSIEEGIQKVNAHAPKTTIVVKDGAKGAIGKSFQEEVVVPAFQIKAINTVGAGDSFNAGFIKGLSENLSFTQSIRYGCATAALKISKDTIPTDKTVQELLRSE